MTGTIDMDQLTPNYNNGTLLLRHNLCMDVMCGRTAGQVHSKNRAKMLVEFHEHFGKRLKTDYDAEVREASFFTFNQAFNAKQVTRLI